jgi:sterol desaturase/sphingolipid hydroxylase (fatty acid hydroxylase superfamily)
MILIHDVGSNALARIAQASAETFFSLSSTFSLASLASALVVAAVVVAAGRLRRRGRLNLKVVARALWPRRAVFGASGKADLGFFFLNTFSTGGLIGWGLLSQVQISLWTYRALAAIGPAPRVHPTGIAAAGLATVVMFATYELAYWCDHWLSHNVPALWELHKVHHTAEALSPLTNFRVHPLESLHFYNLVAILTGVADGALAWGLGPAHGRLMLLRTDVLALSFMFTAAHLQHTHIWLSFRGVLGRIVMSPAAHQIHHSVDPAHHGRNLGNAFALFDWLFGTLHIPEARREPLTFGVPGETEAAHGVTGSLITPLLNAARVLAGRPAEDLGRQVEAA